LVIHVGDLSLDGANRIEDLHHARRQLDRLTVPWRAVPGNHDIGDNPGSDKPQEDVTSQRNERWREIVDNDHWSIELDGWLLVGINAQLFGSGLDDEAAQWDFVEAQLARRDRGSTILILHKPVGVTDAELTTAHPHRYVPEPARQRLMDLVDEDHVPLVV